MSVPDFEVVGAVAGRGMHEAGAGILGDMLAGEKRHIEIVTLPAQWMRRRDNVAWLDVVTALEGGYAGRAHDAFRQRVGQYEHVALLGPVVLGRFRHLIQTV